MDSWRCLCLIVTLFCMPKVSFPLQIYFDASVVGERGRNDTKIRCTFAIEGLEEIINIRFLAKDKTTNDFIQIARFLLDRTSVLLSVSFPLQIYFDASVVGERGRNDTKIRCTFAIEGLEEIINIRFLAKDKTTNDFIQIARFLLDRTSVLLPGGNYLTGRVTLSNITTSSTAAILNFQPLKCIDEKEYQCIATYYNTVYEQEELPGSTNLSVTVNPSEPNLVADTLSVVEGDNITLSCRGDVGKPPGNFTFEKRIVGNAFDQYIVTTESYMLSDSCSYQGTSNLTIQVTDQDDDAVIRCSVRKMDGGVLYSDPQTLDIKYKVRPPDFKEPIDSEYQQGPGTIRLTCIARGNPPPSYIWYKDGSVEDILSPNDTLCISKETTNKSGIYTCNASNTVSDTLFFESTSVAISIVIELKSTTTSLTTSTANKDNTTSPKNEDENIDTVVGIGAGLAGVAVLIVIIVITVLIIIRRKGSHNGMFIEKDVLRQYTVRNDDGNDSVHSDKGDGVRDKKAESQSHNNLGYNSQDIEQTGAEIINKEDETPAPDNRHEYASVNEATKIKNRTIDRKPPEKQRNSNQDDVEDPYI